MNVHRPQQVSVKERKHQKDTLQGRNQGLQKDRGQIFPELSLELILKKLTAGFHKLYVAIKYQFHRLTGNVFENIKFPIFKIGVALVFLFILTKKDIQFSVNMKAPLSQIADDRDNNESQLAIVQAVNQRSSHTGNSPNINSLNDELVDAYIKRFSRVAITEMEKYGIPASIKMAQALLESEGGKNIDTQQHNNHFGKITSGQHYNSAWENWRAHSLLLEEHSSNLPELGSSYKQWTKALQQTTYPNDVQYANKLIQIIEKYQLTQLDTI